MYGDLRHDDSDDASAEDREREWWCGWWREFVRTALLWVLVLGIVSIAACGVLGP